MRHVVVAVVVPEIAVHVVDAAETLHMYFAL